MRTHFRKATVQAHGSMLTSVMVAKLPDRELTRNPWLPAGDQFAPYPFDMAAEKKSDHVTAYVRARVAELESNRGDLADALRKGGLVRNAAAKVRAGGSVGAVREPQWAKALGFASVEELRAAAFAHSQARTSLPLTVAHHEAIERAKPLGQMTEADAERIIRAAWQFWDRPADWWFSFLLAEYKYVRDVRAREEMEHREATRYRTEVRAEKRRLDPPPTTPPAAPAAALPAPRRKQIA